MRHYSIVLIIAVLCFGICNLLQPYIFHLLPGDFKRSAFLLETLQKSEQADILFFGNSIGMSCVDASLVSNQLINNPSCYNLSSNGQLPSESCLLYPMIDTSVKVVIQFLRTSYLEEKMHPLRKATQRNYLLSGYNYNLNVEKEFEMKLGLDYINESHSWKLYYDQRRNFTDAFNIYFRNLLSAIKNIKSIDTELYFPSIYNQKVSSEKLELLVKKHNPSEELTEFRPRQENIRYFERVDSYFESRGIEYILALYPYNSALYHYSNEYKESVTIKTSSFSMPVINGLNVLQSDDFYDDWHVHREGATTFSLFLANQLKQMGYAF